MCCTAAVTWLVKIEGVREPEDSRADTSQQIGRTISRAARPHLCVWLESPITFREGCLTHGAVHNPSASVQSWPEVRGGGGRWVLRL